MFAQSYFSSQYFPPLYFGPTAPATVDPPAVPTAGYRDRDAFAAIVAALVATGELAWVVIGQPPGQALVGPDRIPLAVVTPEGWEEEDDADPIVNVRHVSYSITLIVRDEDVTERYRQLDLLTSVVQDALDGSDLGGRCLPALTKLRRGRFDLGARHPEQRVILTGEFSYLISTHAGHDTTA